MFYRPGVEPHGLPHNPFKAIVAPRPIAWISSIDAMGRPNLAPYSYFNAFGDAPPVVAYGSGRRKIGLDEGKDSLANIEATGEFVVNIVTDALSGAMNVTSTHFEAGEDEFAKARLTPAPCTTVACPRVAEAPAALECKLFKVLDLPGDDAVMVIGEVTGIHIDEAALTEGRFDPAKIRTLARLGYRDYAVVDRVFELSRPDD